MKKSEKTHQGLYNVGFIGIENNGLLGTILRENGPTLIENLESSKSPQSSLICNHTLARGDLLDSRFCVRRDLP
jgi:hypothetical protein